MALLEESSSCDCLAACLREGEKRQNCHDEMFSGVVSSLIAPVTSMRTLNDTDSVWTTFSQECVVGSTRLTPLQSLPHRATEHKVM